jgi:diguanylate cyclase (GGDEF)-like protein/putative nucleotidyltransferase with HDIG domain
MTFFCLTLLATLTHIITVPVPSGVPFRASAVFYFAGVFLLHPLYFVAMVATAHIVDWVRLRWMTHSSSSHWQALCLNAMRHTLAGIVTSWASSAMNEPITEAFGFIPILSLVVAACIYIIVSLSIQGLDFIFAHGLTWKDAGVFDSDHLLSEIILIFLGCIVTVLWNVSSPLILLAISPLVMVYRARVIPQLTHEAHTDSKTGLWNARQFLTLFTAEVERAQRCGQPLAFIMADLDLLRNINNTYGHLAGDVVLAGVGRTIQQTIRKYDVAGRFGGEEFAIVLPGVTRAEAQDIAEQLRGAVEATQFVVKSNPTPISATLSLGIACFPQDASTGNNLIHEADIAVYQAKLQGRNRVVSITDVPQSVKLGAQQVGATTRIEERTASLPFVARAEVADGPIEAQQTIETPAAKQPSVEAGVQSHSDDAHLENEQAEGDEQPPPKGLWVFIASVLIAGLGTAIFGIALQPRFDLLAVGLFTGLALLTELWHVDLYDKGSISVSVALFFAIGLISGLAGVVCVSIATALLYHVQIRPAWYKTAFNIAVHILSGVAPVLVGTAISLPLHIGNLPTFFVPVAVAALAFYVVNTSLISIAIGLATRSSIVAMWREEFQWLVGHYVALCVMGLFLSVAYTQFGVLGIAVFILPIVMMRYTQKQYVDRTEDGVRELRRMNEELTVANQEIATASNSIQRFNDELFEMLARFFDARDPYVSGHAATVAKYATTIATELGITGERLKQVRQAAILHDIGKIAIPETILHKASKLTDAEYELMKTHVTVGAELIEMSDGLQRLAPFIRHHHERWDGRGYPAGLSCEDIPLEARILNVCDSVEAMASDRPYHKGLSPDEVIAEVKRCAGTQFDPIIAEMFVRIVEREGTQFMINSAQVVTQRQASKQSSVPQLDQHINLHPLAI